MGDCQFHILVHANIFSYQNLYIKKEKKLKISFFCTFCLNTLYLACYFKCCPCYYRPEPEPEPEVVKEPVMVTEVPVTQPLEETAPPQPEESKWSLYIVVVANSNYCLTNHHYICPFFLW